MGGGGSSGPGRGGCMDRGGRDDGCWFGVAARVEGVTAMVEVVVKIVGTD